MLLLLLLTFDPVLNVLAVPPTTHYYAEYKSGYVYKPEFEAEYKYHAESKDWYQSMDTCRKENATLLLLDSKQESDFINGLLQFFNTTSISIGGHDGFREDSFETVLGESLNSYWLHWASTEPDGGSKENCLFTTFYANMYDWECNVTLPFICKRIRINEKLQYCNAPYPGFVYNSKLSKCYKLQKNPRNWATAHAVCKSQEANLAFPNSKEEGDHFLNMFYEAFPNSTEDMKILIGIHKHYSKYWQTVKGVPIDKLDHKPWDSTKTDIKRCSALTTKGQLTAVDDDYESIYICEAKNGGTGTIACGAIATSGESGTIAGRASSYSSGASAIMGAAGTIAGESGTSAGGDSANSGGAGVVAGGVFAVLIATGALVAAFVYLKRFRNSRGNALSGGLAFGNLSYSNLREPQPGSDKEHIICSDDN